MVARREDAAQGVREQVQDAGLRIVGATRRVGAVGDEQRAVQVAGAARDGQREDRAGAVLLDDALRLGLDLGSQVDDLVELRSCAKPSAAGGLTSLEMVEINPILDVQNRTGKLAMSLILSALGKAIYRD